MRSLYLQVSTDIKRFLIRIVQLLEPFRISSTLTKTAISLKIKKLTPILCYCHCILLEMKFFDSGILSPGLQLSFQLKGFCLAALLFSLDMCKKYDVAMCLSKTVFCRNSFRCKYGKNVQCWSHDRLSMLFFKYIVSVYFSQMIPQ